MSSETFSKLIELIPLAKDDGFLFSCLFEPTIHPNFVSFLQQIPVLGRRKVFFTTNLAKRLPKEAFHQLSKVNISHINISLDSLNPLVFEDLRRGAKFDIFMENLENLVSVFGKYPDSPRIRFITMVFKQNLNELVDLVSICHKQYSAELHELRTPFGNFVSHIDREWIEKSTISEEEWNELVRVLSKLNLPMKFCGPITSISPIKEDNRDENYSVLDEFPKPSIRVNSDGTMFLTWNRKGYLTYNINEFVHPYATLKRRLYRIYDTATWPSWREAFWYYRRSLLRFLTFGR